MQENFHVGRNTAGQTLEYDPIETQATCHTTWQAAAAALVADMYQFADQHDQHYGDARMRQSIQDELARPDFAEPNHFLAIVPDYSSRGVAFWLTKNACRCGDGS